MRTSQIVYKSSEQLVKLAKVSNTKGILVFWVLLLMSLHTVSVSASETDSIKAIIRDAGKLIGKNHDSAMILLKDAYLQSLEQKNDSLQMMVFIQFAKLYDLNNNHYLSIDYAFKALEIFEKYSLHEMNSKQLCHLIALNNKIGYSYFYLDMKDMAKEYLTHVVELVDTIKSLTQHACSDRVVVYTLNNISGIYLDIEELESARNIFNRIENINRSLNDSVIRTTLNINKGIYYKTKGDFDSAMMAYNNALEFAGQLANRTLLARVHNNIALLHKLTGNTNEALSHYTLAKDMAGEVSSWNSLSIAAKALSEIYAESGDYKNAYENSSLLVGLNDSIFSPAKKDQYARMALQYDFDKELREHQAGLNAQWKEQRNQKLTYRFLTIILSLVVLIVVIILFAVQRKARFVRLEKDYAALRTKQLEQEKRLVEAELNVKKRHLMEKAMWLVQKNEMVTAIATQLAAIRDALPAKYSGNLDDTIKQLDTDTGESFRKEFETRFSNVNQAFIDTLNEKFPELSPAEKRLASFLSLNLSTKEIAAITYQNPDSLKVARSRLRSRLGLEKGENLVNFLISLR